MFVIICYCHLQVPAANDLIALGWSWGAGSSRRASRMGGAIFQSLLPPAPPQGVLGVALVSGGAPVQRGHCCLGPGDVVKRLLPWGVLELSEMSGSGLRREGKRCRFQCSRTSGTGSLDHHVSQLPVVQPWSLGALRGPDLTSLLTNLGWCLVPGTGRVPEFEYP